MHCKQDCPHQVTNDRLPFLHTVRLTAARAEQPKHHGRDWQTSALFYDLTKTARNTAWHNCNTLFTTVWDLGFWLELVTTADTDYLLPTTYYHSYKYSHRPTHIYIYIYKHIQVYVYMYIYRPPGQARGWLGGSQGSLIRDPPALKAHKLPHIYTHIYAQIGGMQI